MTIIARLQGKTHDLGGGFLVRRLLPSPALRSVGPFVFVDHFGPVTVRPEDNIDVRPHPHIGLATVTYLFDGAMLHRDSLGCVQRIEPGAVNWMNAGRGIVHSERRPPDLAGQTYVGHGLQLWTALPKEHEESAPTFQHAAAAELPTIEQEGATVRVLVGRAWQHSSPIETHSRTVYVAIELRADGEILVPPLAEELAAYAVDAPLQIGGETVDRHTLAVLRGDAPLRIRGARGAARLVLIGGDRLDGPRHLWWNFVSSRRERIELAADDWAAGRMATIAGDDEFIPLPQRTPPR